MIILLGGAEILAIFVIFFVLVAGAAETVASMITVFTVLFIIKNVVQTIIVGYFKNKNSLSSTIIYIVLDTIRMSIFFSNLRSIGETFLEATGIGYFSSLFSFILYFLICGSIFIIGEFLSLTQAFRDEDAEMEKGMAVVGEIVTVILLAVVTWVGYL